MRAVAPLLLIVPMLAACSDRGSGQGFELYEVTPSGAPGAFRADLEMQGLPAVPRNEVAAASTPAQAARVRPYGAAPSASVAAVSAEATYLRVVEDSQNAWLVAEAVSGGAPDADRLQSEAVQRSGCLVAGATNVGRSVVFALDCS